MEELDSFSILDSLPTMLRLITGSTTYATACVSNLECVAKSISGHSHIYHLFKLVLLFHRGFSFTAGTS